MDQESLAQIQQIVNAATETLRSKIVDAKRHTGVLTERLRHKLQLVAERFRMHLDRGMPMTEPIWTHNSGKPARGPQGLTLNASRFTSYRCEYHR